jgi:hypothetical protein
MGGPDVAGCLALTETHSGSEDTRREAPLRVDGPLAKFHVQCWRHFPRHSLAEAVNCRHARSSVCIYRGEPQQCRCNKVSDLRAKLFGSVDSSQPGAYTACYRG